MPDPRRRRSVSQSYLFDVLSAQLAKWQQEVGHETLEVVDLGGGTGGLATTLAEQGHQVTVIDPSPDALASLERRTAEMDLTERIRGIQGDAADITELIGIQAADVVICHRVLEMVEAPGAALAGMAAVLRSGGALSLSVAQRRASVLSHALAGNVGLAHTVWKDHRRLDLESVRALVVGAGFELVAIHGIGAVADHVPESLVESQSEIYAELYALEAEISSDPAFQAMAPLVHILARR